MTDEELIAKVACMVKGKSIHDLTETDLEDAETYVEAATPEIERRLIERMRDQIKLTPSQNRPPNDPWWQGYVAGIELLDANLDAFTKENGRRTGLRLADSEPDDDYADRAEWKARR